MVDRLTVINWTDYATGDKHEASRTLLMREFLRRTALWVHFLGGTERWPFFNIAERIDPSVRADPGLIERLNEFTEENIPEFIARRMCRAAVHWAELQDSTQVRLPDLPDPYEPLVVLYERAVCSSSRTEWPTSRCDVYRSAPGTLTSHGHLSCRWTHWSWTRWTGRRSDGATDGFLFAAMKPVEDVLGY